MIDKQIIESHGGPSKVATHLGYTIQRVQNWMTRGIPSKEKLDHPWLRQVAVRRKSRAKSA